MYKHSRFLFSINMVENYLNFGYKWEPPMNIQNSKTLTLQQSTGDAILEPKDTEHWNYLY